MSGMRERISGEVCWLELGSSCFGMMRCFRERIADCVAEMVEAEEERIKSRKDAAKAQQHEVAAEKKEHKDTKESKASSKA